MQVLDQKNLYKSLIKISVKLFMQFVCVSAATALKGRKRKVDLEVGESKPYTFILWTLTS
jgi:hypothetical protein